jgi:aminopeptidase-like protein
VEIGGREEGLVDEAELLSRLFDRLYPICRSITGPGIRTSLQILAEHIPIEIRGVPTGTKVFDWTVPDEWHIKGVRLTGQGELREALSKE